MTNPLKEKSLKEKVDEYWNEHDGTNFYKDEFLDFIRQLVTDTKESTLREIETLREQLAELEHEQWWDWSSDIDLKEPISEERRERWQKQWKSYKQLTEEEKEKDRIWADKVLQIIRNKIKE